MTDAQGTSGSGFLPLQGMRVLDLTSVLFGPYCTQILGDLGADVIKIEAPAGDPTRGIGPARNPSMGAVYLGANRNKRSLVLDLKRGEARDALWRLVEGADFFIHNIRPQKVAALGFDADAVLQRRPEIVYGALHGYLEEGPYSGMPAYDDVIQGQSGVAGAFWARDGEPSLAPSVIADKSAGLLASAALLAATVQRLRTGKGVYVEVGMFEALASYMLVEHIYGGAFDPPEGPFGYARALSPHRRPYRTKDGHICLLAYNDRQWLAFWRLVGRPEIMEDPRFATINARNSNIDALYSLAGACLLDETSAVWLARLKEAEIPAGPVNRLEDLPQDPHMKAIGFFRPQAHPSEGAMVQPDAAIRLDRQSLPLRHHQPKLGEQGREILQEAGFDEAEIETLLAEADSGEQRQ